MIFFVAQDLPADDLNDIRAFNYKVDTLITDRAYDKISLAFPQLADLSSLYRLQRRMSFLSGVKPVKYDCCINSCMCYTGHYKSLQRCPYCHEARLDTDGTPRRTYNYIPIIPRLVALYTSKEHSKKLQTYRSEFVSEPDKVKDVFDGTHYQHLLKTRVAVQGQTMEHRHFSDCRDIALGISFDGFAPFKRRKFSSWPILVFNYNLPPEECFQLENLLCVGQIPGPNSPKDSDSFIFPFVEEMWKAAAGIRAYDALSDTIFALHLYLILGFGDIPAVAKLLKMKGHNSQCSCRMCTIVGIKAHSTSINLQSHAH